MKLVQNRTKQDASTSLYLKKNTLIKVQVQLHLDVIVYFIQ